MANFLHSTNESQWRSGVVEQISHQPLHADEPLVRHPQVELNGNIVRHYDPIHHDTPLMEDGNSPWKEHHVQRKDEAPKQLVFDANGTLYDFLADVINGNTFPVNLNVSITPEVEYILRGIDIGSGICWLWSIAAAASGVLQEDFSSIFEKMLVALGYLYTRKQVVEVAQLADPNMVFPYIKEALHGGIVHRRTGGISGELLKPQYVESTLKVLNCGLQSVEIPVELSPFHLAPKIIGCDRNEIERIAMEFFETQAILGNAVLFPLRLTKTHTRRSEEVFGEEDVGYHLVAVSAGHRRPNGLPILYFHDMNWDLPGVMYPWTLGSFLDAIDSFVYAGSKVVSVEHELPLIIISKKNIADSLAEVA